MGSENLSFNNQRENNNCLTSINLVFSKDKNNHSFCVFVNILPNYNCEIKLGSPDLEQVDRSSRQARNSLSMEVVYPTIRK